MSKEKNIPGNVQEDQRDRKMSKGELVSYGLGGVASTMPSQFKTAYAMNFMSDVAGLHVGAVGILNTLLIIWDAINDPIFGMIMDKVNFKKGKFLPWLQISVIAIPVATILLFTIPTGIPMMAKIIWATLAYMLWDTAYTLCDVPIFGIVTTMTTDQKERISLNSKIGRAHV